ncbi:MAG: dihydropteroate synthase [Chloroflexota bacterium]|nr:dihydropteroate synthase [Anaerolineae bacterium]
METIIEGRGQQVIIGDGRPTVVVGERINLLVLSHEKPLETLLAGDLDDIIRQEALDQVKAGADVLDVTMGGADVDEVDLLPRAVRLVMETVDVPVCIDTPNAEAMAAALAVHKELAPEGKPLIDSVTGQEASLKRVLPLVVEYGGAIVGLCMNDEGIPTTPEGRLAVAKKIVRRAGALGIPPEDILIDCLALAVGADSRAAWITLEAIRMVKEELGVNLSLGISNVSFGLPEPEVVNGAFVIMAIAAGVNCPIADVAKTRSYILSTDLMLGRDDYAMRYIKAFRQRETK